MVSVVRFFAKNRLHDNTVMFRLEYEPLLQSSFIPQFSSVARYAVLLEDIRR